MQSRRELLGAAAAAVAAGAALGPGGRATAAPARAVLKLGVASYSFRKLSLAQAIAACQQIGARYITVKDVHLPLTATAEQLRAANAQITAAGLTILGGGVIAMKPGKDEGTGAAFEQRMTRIFDYAKAAGMPLIVAAPVPPVLDLVERLIAAYDLPVAIHNHGPEAQAEGYPAPQDVLAHVRKRDPRLGVCMDIGHTVRAGADPIRSARDCGARLFDLHIKDVAEKIAQPRYVEVGRGVIDIPGLFRQLQRMRYQGHVALEHEVDPEAPVAGAGASLAYMRGVAAAIGAA